MKKITLFVLVFICVLSIVSCNQSQVNDDTTPDFLDITQKSDNLSEYLTEEGGKQYLILPISKCKVWIQDEYKKYLDDIDVELLKTAEETINDKMAAYTDDPDLCFGLHMDKEGYLCLQTELIVNIDPPNIMTTEYGEIIDNGCNIDHKHVFFSERITK